MRVSCSSDMCHQLDLEHHGSRAPGGTQVGQHHQGTRNRCSDQRGSLNDHSTHTLTVQHPTAYSTHTAQKRRGNMIRQFQKGEERSRELLNACNSKQPHNPVNLTCPKAAHWCQWKLLIFFFLTATANLPNDCLLSTAGFQETKQQWGLSDVLSVT